MAEENFTDAQKLNIGEDRDVDARETGYRLRCADQFLKQQFAHAQAEQINAYTADALLSF
jgi:hypothetical protein